MNIMSQDFRTLVNYDNVCSLYHKLDSDGCFRIYAEHPAIGYNGVLTNVLYTANEKEKIMSVFEKFVNAIDSNLNKNVLYISDYE